MQMNNGSIQSAFLDQIRQRLKPAVSFADELSETLQISRDSAYRRIRGETVLSLDEVSTLSKKYSVSVDSLFTTNSQNVFFHNRSVHPEKFPFDSWLKSICFNLQELQQFPDKKLYFFAKDIPIFYYFNSPTMSAFKMFFWMTTVMKMQEYNGVPFTPKLVPREYLSIGEKIFTLYVRTPRVEIWSEETLNVTLRQIEFYFECGFLEDNNLALQLCEEYLSIVRHIKSLAARGYHETPDQCLQLYKNDLLIADNSILFKMGEKRAVFLPNNTMNILSTTNDQFCRETEDYLLNLTSKSVLISTTGERERNKFFNQMESKILRLKNSLFPGGVTA